MATAPSANSAKVRGIARARPPSDDDLTRARGVQHAAGREEEQRLEEAVVQHVEQRAAETEGHEVGAPERAAERGQTHADRDDADVLDAAVGEQALQILLRHGERDAEHARGRADRRAARLPTTTGGSGSRPHTRTSP